MTSNAGLLCFCTFILLGVFRAAGAQSFEECDKTPDPDHPVGCVALEISEQRDGVRVQVMHHDGSLFLHVDDRFLREIVELEPGFFVQLEPYFRIGFSMESFDSSGEQIRHYGREGAPDPELFVPIATRSFSTPVVTHGTEASGSCADSFPHAVIDELGFWNDVQGFPIEACEGNWTLFEGTFRSLGIIPDVLSIWSSEAQDYKIRTVATASLTIIHRAEPADGTDFNYTVGFSDETERTGFVLDEADVDDGDGIGDTYVLEDPVLAGTYEIAHDQSAGVFDSAVCTGGGDAGTLDGNVLTVDVRGTEDVVCEIFTSKLGRANVNLDMTPSSEQEVAFSGELGDFVLSDGGDATPPATVSFPVVPGTHDASAVIPEGWDLTGLSCDDDDSVADPNSASVTFAIEPAESVACTFSLTQRGSVAIELDLTPDSDQSVEFSGGLGAFVLDDAGSTALPAAAVFEDVSAGAYSVEATIPPGWDLTALTCSDENSVADSNAAQARVALDPGEAVTCLFSLVQHGSATVSLDLLPDSDQVVEFASELGAFSLDDDPNTTMPADITFTGLQPGTYDVAAIVPDGWDLTGVACDHANSTMDIETATAVMEIDPGQSVSCTFEFTQPARLVVELDMLPEHPLPVTFGGGLGQFTLVDDGQSEPTRAFEVEPGRYTLAATSPEGWATSDLACSPHGAVIDTATSSAELDLPPGGEARCTWSLSAAVADLAISGQVEREADDMNRVRVVVDVTNLGPAPASNVMVNGEIADGATMVDSDCELGVGMESLAWSIGAVVDGSSTRCVFVMALPETSSLNLELTVTGEQEDTSPSTNVALFGLGALSAIPVPLLGWTGLLLMMFLLSVSGLVILRSRSSRYSTTLVRSR